MGRQHSEDRGVIPALGWFLVGLGAAGVLLVFAVYPLVVRLAALSRRGDARTAPEGACPGSVSVVCAMRNAEGLLPAKLASLRAQEGLDADAEFVFASDGSDDGTAALLRELGARGEVIPVILDAHEGKQAALNAAAARARGDVLVFTDADALLEPGALAALLRPFTDPGVGGVCGRRMVGEPDTFAGDAQGDYIALDSGLKALESRVGSITSNDGKLYGIRRELFEPIPPGVTDDLFANMSVVRQGYRFAYAGGARAWIRSPSRSARHEFGRRRRIVCRSLRGIWSQRAVLNPLRTGLYGPGLLVNKVGRRLLPAMLLLSTGGLALLAVDAPWARVLLAAGAAGVAAAAAGPALERLPLPRAGRRLLSLAHYFVVGMAGTLLGFVDFVRGQRVVRWDPRKGT